MHRVNLFDIVRYKGFYGVWANEYIVRLAVWFVSIYAAKLLSIGCETTILLHRLYLLNGFATLLQLSIIIGAGGGGTPIIRNFTITDYFQTIEY
jgi:hypothetical protein